MSDSVFWCLAAVWGSALGLFYFGGLWWTLQSLSERPRPRSWLALSYVVRTALVLAGFWLVLRKGAAGLFFALGAFFLMRVLITRRLLHGKGGHTHADQP